MWGGDLYTYQRAKRNWRWQLTEICRRFVIKRLGHLVSFVEGDVELARKWYGATGQYHECIMYPSNVFQVQESGVHAHDGVINIQVGNSASASNNHLEVFDKLGKFRDKNISIFVPLSYGDREYARLVIKTGVEKFGDKFHPLTALIPLEEYRSYLNKIDIAIFNHHRQQGMGNIITLLGLGKKVFMRDDVTQWETFEKIGVKIYSISEVDLTPMDEEVRGSNQSKIKSNFSDKKLISGLSRIFYE